MKEKFARWETLFLQYLKRDWKKMIFWILGVSLFSAGFAPAFTEIAKGEGAIGFFETLQNPAMISLVGPTPVESGVNYTVGAMYAHEMLLFSGIIAMIVSALHVVSHTRKEEDLGLTELVRSFQIGRQANSLAVIVQTVLINLVNALLIAGMLVSFNIDSMTVEGSFLFGASVGMAGIVGGVLALIMAQIMPTSSSATGSSLGLIGLLYIIRAGTDVSNINLSYFNPMGWNHLTYPFTEDNWYLLIFSVIFSVIILIIAFALEGARDMGSGYLPERTGRPRANNTLLSVPGLFFRLNRGTIISWLIGFVVLGISYGSIFGDMQTFLESNEFIEQMFTQSGVSMEASFTSTLMIVMIGLVSVLPIVIVNKLFAEESRSHLSQIFSTKVKRSELYWTSVGLAIISGLIGILLATGSLGATAIAVMGETESLNMVDFLNAGFNLLPSVLFFIGLAALALGWIPKLGKVIYAYLGFSFMLNYFANILDLPEWFLKTAIQSWLPNLPMEDFDLVVFSVMTLISVAMMVIGYFGYHRRDLQEGA